MPDLLQARLAHQIPGRTRLRLEGEAADHAELEQLAESIAAMPGVRRVDIRADTGSILIRHIGAFETVSEGFEAIGLALLPAVVEDMIDPIGDTGRELGELNAAFDKLTGGKIDFWSAAFLGVLGIGLWQLGRGRVAGPALTVLGQAATIAMARPFRPSKRK